MVLEKLQIRLSKEDKEYCYFKAGELYGASKDAMPRLWARMVEVYKIHSGEIKPE